MKEKYKEEKSAFLERLKYFASTLAPQISQENEWTIRGFIDIFRNVYPLTTDTKVISKILELHLFPYFLAFAQEIGYEIELATYQNWYPDLTFINKSNFDIKFAVDLKTTYRDELHPGFCNGFTLGSHGTYFVDRACGKNIQYPYNDYSGHFCLGIIYSRSILEKSLETHRYSIENLETVPAVIRDLIFFAEEKWRIASDQRGSGNTANIGSIKKIDDILKGHGVFALAGEELFDDYWVNYNKIGIKNTDGEYKLIRSFAEYLRFRGLPENLNNSKANVRKEIRKG